MLQRRFLQTSLFLLLLICFLSINTLSVNATQITVFSDEFTTPYNSIYPFEKYNTNFAGAREPSNINVSGTWYYYYSYNNTTATNVYLKTGASETAYTTGTMVLPYAIYSRVYYYGENNWRMLYSPTVGQNSINLATSTDGSTWTPQGILISRGTDGSIDDTGVFDPCEYIEDGTYHLYYSAFSDDSSGGNGVVGYATSSTGLPESYTKQGAALEHDHDGLYDSLAVNDPFIIEYDTGKYAMFFSAWNGTMQTIGYATSTNLNGPWIKSNDNPVAWPTAAWETSANKVREPYVVVENEIYKVWYASETGNGYLTLPQNATTKLPTMYPAYKWTYPASGTFTMSNGYLNLTTNAYQITHTYQTFTNFTLTTNFSTAGGNGAISFRVADINNTYMVESSNAVGGTRKLTLFKKAGGTYTSLGVGTTTFALNTPHAIKVDANGTSLKVYLDDNLEVNVTDSTYTTGQIYLGGVGNVQQSFNDVTITETVYIPVSNFSASSFSGIKPLTVNFTDLSEGTIDTYAWNFGDGSDNVTTQNCSHVFADNGTYAVILTVSNDGGESSIEQTITVNNPAAPVSNFNATALNSINNRTITFTDLSTGLVDYRTWDFGDGTTSTEQNPTHTYDHGDNYPVSLTVSNDGGSDTMTQTIPVYGDMARWDLIGDQTKSVVYLLLIIPIALVGYFIIRLFSNEEVDGNTLMMVAVFALVIIIVVGILLGVLGALSHVA